ncbi:hypothetical protein [Globicatella sanguinis]
MEQNFFETILLSGSIGMVHYWILNRYDNFEFLNIKMEDKKGIFLILTAINILTLNGLMDATMSTWNFQLYYLLSFFISFYVAKVILILLDYYLHQKDNLQLGKRIPVNSDIHILQKMIDKDIALKDKFAVIFTIDGKFIEQGYIQEYEIIEGNRFDFRLKITAEPRPNFDFKFFREHLDSIDAYVSLHDDVKIYIFDQPI